MRRRGAPVPACILAAAFAAGCASKLPQTPESFTIDAPAPAAAKLAGTRVVSLRRADVASPYGGASLVYRIGEHAVERDPYASLASPPSWMITSAIRGYLENADFIRGVVAPAERVFCDAAIEPAVTELAGDFTNASEPAAVLSIQFRVLVSDPNAAVPRVALVKTYSRRTPLQSRTAALLVAAWNQELAEIMGEFLADLKGALPSS